MSAYRRLTTMLVVLLVFFAPTPAVAELPDNVQPQAIEVPVNSTGPGSRWEGEVARYGSSVGDVPECRKVYCEAIDVSVQLPKRTWKRPGGLQIAIRWDGATNGALGLVVYRDGERVAMSVTDMGTAQSVTIPEAPNGDYDVYVTYGVTRGAHLAEPEIAYEGIAEVEYKPRVKPVRDLLPDLVAISQENVTYERPPRYFNDFASVVSCFYSERVEESAEQCLRFDQVLKNAGSGPVEIRFDREAGQVGREDVAQRIYRSDDTHYAVPSGQVEFHDIHGHYHFEGFAQSELWHLNDEGELIHDQPSAVGRKVSFCITDTDLARFGKKGDAPLSYPASDCLDPKERVGTTERFWYGLSAGWADRYGWYLPDQMIDTQGLKDGRYAMFTTVDPDRKLRESNESNNCSSVVVEVTGLSTRSPQARLLGQGPKCPDEVSGAHH